MAGVLQSTTTFGLYHVYGNVSQHGIATYLANGQFEFHYHDFADCDFSANFDIEGLPKVWVGVFDSLDAVMDHVNTNPNPTLPGYLW